MHIHSQKQFEKWLEQQNWLQDAFVDSLIPTPSSMANGEACTSSVAQLGLRLWLSGGCAAGERRRVRELRLTATGVTEYSISSADGFSPGHCCQGADLIEQSIGIGIVLDAPADIRLVCTAIEVDQIERTETVEAWYSDREFYALVPRGTLPTPQDWIDLCRDRGFDVVWRYYGSDERSPDRVPQRDYSGWFLQFRSELGDNPQGLFFFHGCQESNGFRLHVKEYGRNMHHLWRTAADFIARFDGATMQCGNVTLSGEDWRRRDLGWPTLPIEEEVGRIHGICV